MEFSTVISTKLMAGLCLAAMAVAGPDCLPKRVYWSPDGQKAVILTDEQTFVTSASGELSPATPGSFEQVAWFPDSKRLVAIAGRELSTWAQVKEVLTPEQAAKLMELAQPFREQVLAHEGSWDDWQPHLNGSLSPFELVALWIYTREHQPEELRGKLGEDWEKLAGINLTARRLQLCEVSAGIACTRVLAETLCDIGADSLHISPDGRLIAYVLKNCYIVQEGKSEATQEVSEAGGALMLLSLDDGAEPRMIEPFAAWRSDFMADGRALVYATAKPVPRGESLVLGSIERRKITAGNGKIQVAEPEQLAGIIYLPNSKVVCLDDGKILFSTANVTLPTATTDLPRGSSLFSIEPEQRATIAPMLTRSAESTAPMAGFDHGVFDVRPDGGAVTLIGSGKDGEVAWYSFATGAVQYVVSSRQDWTLLERPTWRDNEELSLIVPPGHPWGSPKRAELVLYSLHTKLARCISKGWPDALMDTWMPEKKQTTQTQPE